MISKIFTVYDVKTEAYLNPFFMATKGAAIRGFSELVNDPNHNFGKYPADFILFEIGSYDDQRGLVESLPAPLSVGVGVDFLKKS